VEEIEEIVRHTGAAENDRRRAEENAANERRTGDRFCRRCDYCRPCQQEIPISMVMTFPSFVKRMPPERTLKGGMFEGAMAKAATCLKCGECEEKCPFHLPIREMLTENLELYKELKAGTLKIRFIIIATQFCFLLPYPL
jgi:predicted aldo/keto reductase-like oxidoreductase